MSDFGEHGERHVRLPDLGEFDPTLDLPEDERLRVLAFELECEAIAEEGEMATQFVVDMYGSGETETTRDLGAVACETKLEPLSSEEWDPVAVRMARLIDPSVVAMVETWESTFCSFEPPDDPGAGVTAQPLVPVG